MIYEAVGIFAVGFFAVGFFSPYGFFVVWNFRSTGISQYGIFAVRNFRNDTSIEGFHGAFKLRKFNHSTAKLSHSFEIQL